MQARIAAAALCCLGGSLGLAAAGPASATAPRSTGHAPLTATFAATTYVPGERAVLLVRTRLYRRLELQILRAGAERAWSSVGRPWGPPRRITLSTSALQRVVVRPGLWPSGLYFARLRAPGGKAVAFAPFVLHPPVLGGSRVAVVLPTFTWQAYNFYDANNDRRPDSWYGDARRNSVTLGRPFTGDGKPPHYRTNQRGFLRFLVHSGKSADYLTDEDLERIASGDDLARLYDLVVFSGHEEYVTGHMYDITQRYRDLGGNLAFLSADNFFRQVISAKGKLWRGKLWRDVGRPEAALIGVQYAGNDRGGHVAPYVAVQPEAAPWLFTGLAVGAGAPISQTRYGIEFDAVSASSPPGTAVLAQVDPGLRGGAIKGQMTYYETPTGARVFAAGTLGFGGSDNPIATVLYQNLWAHLTVP